MGLRDQAYRQTVLYVFPFVMFLVPSSPPPQRFTRVLCPPGHLSRVLYPFIFFASSPSISVYSAAPLQQRLALHRPSVGSLHPSGWRPTNVLSCFPVQRPICRFAPPPDLCGWWCLAWVWAEGRRRRRPPRWSGVPQRVGRRRLGSVPSLTLKFSLWFLRCPSLCLPLPPPLPLSSYNRTCPYTLPTNGRVFSWLLRAPLPRWTRPSWRLL